MKDRTQCPGCGIEQFTNGSTVSNWRNKGKKYGVNGNSNTTYLCKKCNKYFNLSYKPEQPKVKQALALLNDGETLDEIVKTTGISASTVRDAQKLMAQQASQKPEELEENMENDTSAKVKRLENILISQKGAWLSRSSACKQAKVDQGFIEIYPEAAAVYHAHIDAPRLEKLSGFLSDQVKKMDKNSLKKLLSNNASMCNAADVGLAWFGECKEAKQMIQEYLTEEIEGSQDEQPIDVPLSANDSLSKEIESLKADHSHQIEELEAEIKRLIAEIQTRPIGVDLNMQSTIDTCKGTISNLNEELARSKQENEQLRAKIAGMQQQIDSVKAEYVTVIEENRYLKAKKESGVDFDRLISDLRSEVKQKEYLLSAAMELQRSIAGER